MVDYWFFIIVSLSIAFLLKSFKNLFSSSSSAGKSTLPPGPGGLPFIGNLLLIRSGLEQLLRSLHAKHGPAVTLRIGSQPAIFVADRATAHRALVQNGAVFADRPPASPVSRIISSNQHNISFSFYGPTWRLLRRNLTAEILHPSRVKNYSHARVRVLEGVRSRVFGSDPVRVQEPFQYAMFCLLAYMCFGDELEEKQILEIELVERKLLCNYNRFAVLDFAPWITRILMRKRWSELLRLRKDQEDVLIPLIRSRKRKIEEERDRGILITAYVDTLFDLELPDENRKLTETEIVSLCNEFLIAGADTTAIVLQWIMANLVKYPNIQTKLFDEIKLLIGETEKTVIEEEDLRKLPYLKAVVLEGLRRHPPGHFLLPHAVKSTTELGGGYSVSEDGIVNFMVAEIGRDPEAWVDPMSFNPERFLDDTVPFDIMSGKEIKMMPFGAGRRMCPAYGLAVLHLEYFVANLIWSFEWKEVDGVRVDLSEEIQPFAVTMKNPLVAHVSSRFGVR
ncbi:Cytochrome P450 89A2 [Linum grandiflorum]